MAVIHEVSFKNNELELGLFHNIKASSGVLGVSGWMKLAAFEKIQREINGDIYLDGNNYDNRNMKSQRIEQSKNNDISKSPLGEKQIDGLLTSMF